MSALSIRMETLTKGGMTPSTVTAVLSHWTPAEANKWMTENTEVVHLSPGDVVFFLFGALVWTIGTSSEPSISIWCPVLSEKLFLGMPAPDREELIRMKTTFVKDAAHKHPWNKIGDMLIRWMGTQ